MNVAEFNRLLSTSASASLQFVLPDGGAVPAHFHVTEVGRIDKSFIDCGGTRRQAHSCALQLWSADDVNHRLTAGKLAAIMKLAEPILNGSELPIEVEYGTSVAATYTIGGCSLLFGRLRIELVGKQTDCLAKEKCGC